VIYVTVFPISLRAPPTVPLPPRAGVGLGVGFNQSDRLRRRRRATAFNLVRAGKRLLVLERGNRLPRDGSTLDVKQVFKGGRFKNHDLWVDNHNRVFIPDEHYNVGGKTKWYGAALLRFSPAEFEADPAHQCLAWPFGYDELKPYYDQAEELLRKHFDGFASACAYKSDAEWNLLTHIEGQPTFTLMPNKQVAGFLHSQGAPQEITGVACTDGSTYRGSIVILAAGAMTRLLQDHLERTELERTLPSAAMVGANFKFHINSALLALSPFERHDVLRKTAIFFNDAYPHSNVQCLGWMDGDILATQLPAAVPKFVAKATGARAVGFFVTTEDGSSPENRIVSCLSSPCDKPCGYGGWWFWRRRHQQHGSYLGRIRSELA
jgi:hypothetical protein